MSVYRKKNSPHFHFDFIYKGHRFHGSTGKTTEREAKAVERQTRDRAIRDVATGDIDKKTQRVPTLDEAALEWWSAKGEGLKSASTLEARLAQAVELIGKHLPVNEIGTSDIARAITKRRGILTGGRKKRVIKNATANRDIIDTVRPILRRQSKLLNDGKGPPIAFPVIDWAECRLPEPKPKPRDFTAAQLDSFEEALPVWWHDFYRIQSKYGLRLSEMFFGLEDLDIEGLRLRLTGRKGDDDHHMPLSAEDGAMLAARLGRAKAAKLNTVWFRPLKGGGIKALTRGGALQAMRRAATESGLRASRGMKGSHDLRHHAGMTMLRETDNLRTTQRLLGHADIKSTLVYAHAMESDLRAAIDKLSRPVPERANTEVEQEERKALRDKGK